MPQSFPSPDPLIDGTLLHQLLAALDAGEFVVGLYDEGDVLRFANAKYRAMFLRGRSLPVAFGDVLRHGFHGNFGVQIDCRDIEAFIADVCRRRRGKPFRAFEVDTVDGQWLWMTETLLPSGWLLSVACDITGLKHNEKSLRQAHEGALHAARTDHLTGVPNRRYTFESARAMLADWRQELGPFSVVVIDLDDFKSINDRFGHDAGDRVLRDFAAQCQRHLRQHDFFGRIGGEEFLLLLPTANLAEADRVLQRLREELPAVSMPAGNSSLRYTFSAGIAEAAPGDDLDDLVRRADRALYQAKRRGRNRTEFASNA